MTVKQASLIIFPALFIAMLGAGIIAPTMPLYAEKLGASGFSLGFIWAAFSISRAVFMPISGRLSDRRGRKAFIVTGLAIYAAASLGYMWSDSVIHLIWVRFLHGIGSAMVVPIAAAVIGDLAPHGHEGRVMGSFGVFLFLGFGFGPILGGLVSDLFSVEAAFITMGALSLASCLSIMVFLPEKRNDNAKTTVTTSFRLMWHMRKFRALLAFRFSNAVCRATVFTFIPVLAAGFNVSPGKIGLLVSVNVLLTGISQHFFGFLADRFDRRLLIAGGNLCTSAAMLLVPLGRGYADIFAIGILMGLGSGVAYPSANAVATELGRNNGMGNIMGFFNLSMSIGMIAGPLLSGAVHDLISQNAVFIAAGAIGIAGSLYCFPAYSDTNNQT